MTSNDIHHADTVKTTYEDFIVSVRQRPRDVEEPRPKDAVEDGALSDGGSIAAPFRALADTVVAALSSDAKLGLNQTEALRRLEHYGPNRLKSAPGTPWWRRLLEQFENFLVIILLIATVISGVEWLLQDPRESALP